MDHPLRSSANAALRRRVIQLLRAGYSIRRDGNIIFVCGGNHPSAMRQQFQQYCKTNHPDFDIFFPEFAMKDYFSTGDTKQFDLADFETMIAELSHSIVLFPEAPGSYAEAGYFSAVEALSAKTILVLDSRWQGKDSFISMGPAKKISSTSKFYGTIQIQYSNPDFDIVVQRINRTPLSTYKKSLAVDKFSGLSTYEKFCLIHKLFDILTIATIDDINFFFGAIFSARFSRSNVCQLTSILVGAGYLAPHGDYGHYGINRSRGDLLKARSGHAGDETSIRAELASIYSRYDSDFLEILEEVRNVA